jgi:hypothetical protein
VVDQTTFADLVAENRRLRETATASDWVI